MGFAGAWNDKTFKKLVKDNLQPDWRPNPVLPGQSWLGRFGVIIAGLKR